MIVLLAILILLIAGTFPVWPWSREWGHTASNGIGLILVILIVLLALKVV
jgi:hypothetical protein